MTTENEDALARAAREDAIEKIMDSVEVPRKEKKKTPDDYRAKAKRKAKNRAGRKARKGSKR